MNKIGFKQVIILILFVFAGLLVTRKTAPVLAANSAYANADVNAVCTVAEPGSQYWLQYCQSSASGTASSNYTSNGYMYYPTPYPTPTPVYYPTTPAASYTNPSASQNNLYQHYQNDAVCNVAEPGSPYWLQYCQGSGATTYYPTQNQNYYPTTPYPTPAPVYYPPSTYQPSPTNGNQANLYQHYRGDAVCNVAEPGSPYWLQYCQ